MKDGKSIGAVGILLIAAAAVLVFGVAGLFPGLTKVLTVILVVAVITVAAVVAAVVYFAFRKPSEHKTVNKGQQISRGRKSLMELRTLNRKTENEEKGKRKTRVQVPTLEAPQGWGLGLFCSMM